MKAPDMLEHALEWIRDGFFVFPIYEIMPDGNCACGKQKCKSPGKHPRVSGGCKVATNNSDQIRRWWSRWPNANIGAATGEEYDVVVIDVDDKNNGLENFQKLKNKYPQEFSPNHTRSHVTGGGGIHLIYSYPYQIKVKNSQGKICKGVDVRGDGGYVLLPSSNHYSGGKYAKSYNGPIEELDCWFMDFFKDEQNNKRSRRRKKKSSFNFSAESDQSAVFENIIEDCEWLASCNSNACELGEEDWYYGLSIVARCKNSETLIHKFSEKHPDYSRDETIEKAAHALSAAGPVTCGTVASKLGHSSICQRCKYYDQITSPIVLGLPINPLMKRYCYLKDQDAMYDLETMAMFTRTGFRAANLDRSKNLAEKFLSSQLFVKADRRTYAPNEPKIIRRDLEVLLNIWMNPGIELEEGDVSTLLDHISFLFPDPYEQETVLNFLAYVVQNEGSKISYALIIIGKQGTGKSFIGEMMRLVLGSHNVACVETNELKSEFNSWMAGTSLVIIEELMAVGKKDIANKLKPLITQPSVRINEKNEKRYEIENCANFIIFTNHHDPINLESDDRRYCVLDSPAEPRGDDYYKNLWNWMENNLGIILHHLKTKDMSNFNPKSHAPVTEAKLLLQEETEPDHVKEIRGRIEKRLMPFRNPIFSLDQIEQAHELSLPKPILRNRKKLADLLKRCGCVKLRQVVINEKGAKKHLWAAWNTSRWEAASDRDLAEMYNTKNLPLF